MASVQIAFRFQNDVLSWKFTREDKQISWTDAHEPPCPDLKELGLQLRHSLRPHWYDFFPITNLQVEIDDAILKNEKLESIVGGIIETLEITQKTYEKWVSHKQAGEKFDGIFFYSAAETQPFQVLAEHLKNQGHLNTQYESFDPGFDPVSRTWKDGRCLSPDELIQRLLDQKIGVVVSNNNYYLDYAVREGVLLFPILKMLGVDWITFEFDAFDLVSWIYPSIHSHPDFRRFAIELHMRREWEELYKMSKAQVSPAFFCVSRSDEVARLDDDFEIVIATNTRTDVLMQVLPYVLYAFEKCRDTHLYTDITIWYHAMRHLVLNEFALSLSEKEKINQILLATHLSAITLLKFETIETLKTKRKIRLFGDKGWQNFFPEYYQNQYLSADGYKEVFGSGKSMGLLINHNFSYLYNNLVFQRAIDLKAPFLGFESLIWTKEFEPFKAIEYATANELSEKIESIQSIYENKDLLECRRNYIEMYQDFVEQMSNYLQKPRYEKEFLSSAFSKKVEEHEALYQSKLHEYIATHRRRLETEFVELFRKKVKLSFMDSKFRDRRYAKSLSKFG